MKKIPGKTHNENLTETKARKNETAATRISKTRKENRATSSKKNAVANAMHAKAKRKNNKKISESRFAYFFIIASVFISTYPTSAPALHRHQCHEWPER